MIPPQWLSPADGWAYLEGVVAFGAKSVSTIIWLQTMEPVVEGAEKSHSNLMLG